MKHTSPKPAYATPEQLDALRRNQTQSLYNMAEALLQAFEAVHLPKDITGIDRAANATTPPASMLRRQRPLPRAMPKP